MCPITRKIKEALKTAKPIPIMGAVKMTLQDYKRLVKSFLKCLKTPEQRIKNLMKECESDIQEAYKKNWDVKLIAIPMSMNFL